MTWSKIYPPILIVLLLLMLVACQNDQQTAIATATRTFLTVTASSTTPKNRLAPTKEVTSVVPRATKEAAVSALTLSELPIKVTLPKEPGYSVSEQEGAEGALASYKFQSLVGCEMVCLQEINVFSLATCSANVCGVYTTWSVNQQKEQHPAENRVDKFIDEPCENDSCVVREYVTYLGNIVVSTRLNVKDESQIEHADELFAKLSFQSKDLAALFGTQETLLEWVKAAWEANTNPAEVQATLLLTGWIKDESSLLPVDLDGDGQEEWLITLIDDICCFDKELSPSSVWLVDDGQIIFNLPPQPRMVNRVLHVRDITGDQLADIVVESATYGANYYPLEYHVLSTHHGTISSIVQPPSGVNATHSFDDGDFISMGVENWEEVHFLDLSGDGLDDLILSGMGGGGAGGGVSRSFWAVWSWDGEAMTLADITWPETKYRFHTLYNANDAFEKGDEQTADLLYWRVIFDELLSDDVSSSCSFDQETDTCKRNVWAPVQELYESNRQFAAFRLTLLALLSLNREPEATFLRDEATFLRDWLQKQYPDAPLTQAADLLLNEWDATQQLDAACAAVNASLTSTSHATGPLADMGYNNPQLTPPKVCVPGTVIGVAGKPLGVARPPLDMGGEPLEMAGQPLWMGRQPLGMAGQPLGIAPTHIAQDKSVLEGELEDHILITQLQATPKPGYLPMNEKVNVFPLQVGDQQAPLWVAFTNGSIADYPALEHFLGIYTREDEQWKELAHLNFSEPNYIDDSSVRQVKVDPDYLWLELFGGVGVGANSSQYKVLRFDGRDLHVEIDHVGSIHVGDRLTPIDLDEDGALELVLSPVENYVFCVEQCDVRYYQFQVLRWDGNAFTEVPLTTLPESAPAELRDLNNRAVELARAGLWKDALTTIRQARAIDYERNNPAVSMLLWNEILISLHAEAKFKHTLDKGDKNYPLLAHVLYGDYDNALQMMRPYPVEEIFRPQSALITGTIAAEWKLELNDWTSKAVEKAISAQPELAAAYFLRGWSTYLVDPNDPQVLFDIERAAELASDERLFQESLKYFSLSN